MKRRVIDDPIEREWVLWTSEWINVTRTIVIVYVLKMVEYDRDVDW